MTKPVVNITIPVFNRYELTQLTIIHLNKMDRSIPFVITVVDNGSEERLRNKLIEFKENNLIQNLFILDKNYGISCACNIGWQSVDAPFYLKCDNDIIVHDRFFLKNLLNLYSSVEPMSTLGPALLDTMILNSPKIIEKGNYKLAVCTSNLPGGALLIPKCVNDILGFFNEDYGLYGADDGDYGMRMNQANFHQYYYTYQTFFKHEGLFGNLDYFSFDLNKIKEHKNLFKTDDGMLGLFIVNCYLYDRLIRNWNVPLRYEIERQDGYYLKIKERDDYKLIRSALIRSQKILNQYNQKIFYNYFFNNKKDYSDDEKIIEKLKIVWKKCGQECTFENLTK